MSETPSISDRLGITDCEVAIEPVVADVFRYKTVNGQLILDKDGTVYPNVFDYNVGIYKYQLAYLKDQKEKLETRDIKPLLAGIKAIDEFVARADSVFRRKEIEVITRQDELDFWVNKYNKEINKKYFKGDMEEVAVQKKIAALKGVVPALPSKGGLYRANAVNLLEPKKGKQYFEDLRVLKKLYEARIKEVRLATIEPLEDKIACTESALDGAVSARKDHYKK